MSYYETLGVAETAEPQVIEAAYKAMIRKYHPDVFNGRRDEAERRSKALNEAYQTLRHPESRAAYDRTFKNRADSGPPPPPPETEADQWEWESDPLDLRRSVEPELARYGLKVTTIAFVVMFAVLVVAKSFRGTVEAQPQPLANAAAAPASERTHPEQSPTSIAAVTEDCRGAKCRTLTAFGWGGIEAGVTTSSAEHSSRMRIRDDGHYTEAGDGSCLSYEVVGGPKNLSMLVESGNVTTVEAYLEPGQPVFRTDRGVKLGDPEAAVRAAYKGLKQLPDIYSEPPDKKLFHYEPGGERGIKFSINKGKVTGISVGTKSIEYVEGCL